jgi:hypothetical protein
LRQAHAPSAHRRRDRFSFAATLQALDPVNSTIETSVVRSLVAKNSLSDILLWHRRLFMPVMHDPVEP